MLITESNVIIGDIPSIFIEGDKTKSAVVMTHGIMGSKNEYLDTLSRIAEQLEMRNIASLRFDFAGHGDSKRSLDEFSLSSQVSDLRTAINWLLNKGYSKINLLGISFGGPPAIITSSLFSDVVEKCVLVAPVSDYKATFLCPSTIWGVNNFGKQKVLDCLNTGKLFLEDNYYLSLRVLLDILLVDIPTFSKMLNTHFVVFHGKCDDMVPLSSSREFANNCKNVELIELENTEHGLTEVNDFSFLSDVSLNNLFRVVEELHDH